MANALFLKLYPRSAKCTQHACSSSGGGGSIHQLQFTEFSFVGGLLYLMEWQYWQAIGTKGGPSFSVVCHLFLFFHLLYPSSRAAYLLQLWKKKKKDGEKKKTKRCNLHFHMLPVAPGRVDNWVESGDGESRIERDTEKANWKKKTSHYRKVPPPPPPFHSSFCHAALNHLCSWKDLPWPPILSHSRRITLCFASPRASLPPCFCLIHIHPEPASLNSLPPSLPLLLPLPQCVTHSMALIHQLVLRADNGLCRIAKRERETRIQWGEGEKKKTGSKIEREGATKGRETEGRIRRGGERESVCGGGGVFMDVVAENVEMLRLLWTSIQWKEHDGKSAPAVMGLLYKSWGVTPMLLWLQILSLALLDF